MGGATYTIGTTLGGIGIGRIAGRAAEGLDRAGLLSEAIAWDATDVDITGGRVRTVPFGGQIDRFLHYYPNDMPFDLLTSRLVGSPDVFHGWNNMCLRTLRKAAQRGATTAVERASTHPDYQRRLVDREYREHGIDESFGDDRLYRRAMLELQEADAVFVPSEFVYESFVEEGFDESRLVLTPFGVDVDRYTPPEDPSAREEEFTALFVGSLSLRKGIQYLLPAWQKADVDGRLVLLGNVRDTAADVVDEYRDDPSIEFPGFVENPIEVYRESSVFAFPSIEEGSALVTYEAMATGLPSVVTPNTGSLVEDGEHGRVVPPRDVDAVADALEELAADPDRRRAMGRAAREKVEDYTWTDYGDRVAEAYRDRLL